MGLGIEGGNFMKKVLALCLVGLLVLAGCSSGKPADEKLEEKTYSIGTAIMTNYTADAGDDGSIPFESNVTYFTVALEGDKIAYLTLDAAQNDITVKDGQALEFKAKGTKKELLEDYGMSQIPGGKGEWYKQVIAFQKYAVGKTVEELKTGDVASDLSSSVSINLTGFIAGVELAASKAVKVDNVARIANASTTGSQTKAGETDLEIVTTVAAVATNKEGKVVYSFVDEAQAKAAIVDGVPVIEESSLVTKGEKKEAYGMSANGLVEWYKQVETLTDWTMGKTMEEIAKGGDDADLTSKVTIYPGSFFAALDKALAKTKL